jgi:hypothetical protein
LINKWHREGEAMPVYEIRIRGHLDSRWSAWFDGMALTNEVGGETVLLGPVVDQAALHSLLIKVHSLNLTLISVLRIETDSQPAREMKNMLSSHQEAR